MKKKVLLFLSIIIVFVILILWVFEDTQVTKLEQPYKEFYSMVTEGKIESVTIKDKNIFYIIKDDENLYKTENPKSPNLKEFLLLNSVKVTEKKGIENIETLLSDILFYLFLIVLVIFAYKKLVSPNSIKIAKKSNKTFNDIVGMDNLKEYLLQIVDVLNNPEIWSKKGVRLPKGILLEGDPGNGKTLLAKALANEAKVKFIPTKATDFESMFMSIGPSKVKELFRKARKNKPCIIFIDEFDGIGTKRNYSGSAIETENTRIVTALLNELDGFETNDRILVIAATNNASVLDKALIRPGRFDSIVKIPYPNEKEIKDLILMYSRNKILDESLKIDDLVKLFKDFSCAKIESVLNSCSMKMQQKGEKSITKDIVLEVINNC